MSVEADRPLPGAAACPCRHGDVAAEVARQRPLLERAARGDRQAFGSLFDEQVEGVYRYLLAWTGDRTAAEELTGQVFHAALARPPVTVGTAPPAEAAAGAPRADTGDVGAWLVAMARDAVARWRGTGWTAGQAERPSPADPLEAVALLGDPERDVVVLRLLLGHSLAHTAHLSGYGQPTVVQLQLTACLAIRSMTGGWSGGPLDPGPQDPAGTTPRALELDRHLDRWDTEVAGDDHELADALAVAASLRLAAPAHVVAPATSSSSASGRSCWRRSCPAEARAKGCRRTRRTTAATRWRRGGRPVAAFGTGPGGRSRPPGSRCPGGRSPGWPPRSPPP
jgi:RNA polymerase sigma-70 factor (ECF subfamily)